MLEFILAEMEDLLGKMHIFLSRQEYTFLELLSLIIPPSWLPLAWMLPLQGMQGIYLFAYYFVNMYIADNASAFRKFIIEDTSTEPTNWEVEQVLIGPEWIPIP
jgi:uncharacterized membrane protein